MKAQEATYAEDVVDQIEEVSAGLPNDEELNNMSEEDFQAMLETMPHVSNADMRRFMNEMRRKDPNKTKPTFRKTKVKAKRKAAKAARKGKRK